MSGLYREVYIGKGSFAQAHLCSFHLSLAVLPFTNIACFFQIKGLRQLCTEHIYGAICVVRLLLVFVSPSVIFIVFPTFSLVTVLCDL